MRITLTMWPGGVLRLHHDAGHNITLLLAERDANGDIHYVPAQADKPNQAIKAVPTNTETTIARVLTTEPIIRLESES